jgi:hypothetical protein
VLSAPTRPDVTEPAAPEAGFVHEKWWIEEAVERATRRD